MKIFRRPEKQRHVRYICRKKNKHVEGQTQYPLCILYSSIFLLALGCSSHTNTMSPTKSTTNSSATSREGITEYLRHTSSSPATPSSSLQSPLVGLDNPANSRRFPRGASTTSAHLRALLQEVLELTADWTIFLGD